MSTDADATLIERAQIYCREHQHVRARQLATELGVREGGWLQACANCDALSAYAIPQRTVFALKPDFLDSLMAGLRDLGELLAITRNEWAVHEKPGSYGEMRRVHGPIAVITGEQIDLRLFTQHWSAAFLVVESSRGETPDRTSVQIFDGQGEAVHKIYARDSDQAEALHKLAAALRRDPSVPIAFSPEPDPKPEKPDSEIDVAGFQQTWRDLKDTHAFAPMLRKFGVGRTQALRLAPEGMARQLSIACAKPLLDAAVESKQSIMVFAGNRGCIQIHTGPIERVTPARGWLNVLDPGFNLHLKEEGIAQAWQVSKPTDDGIVTSIELFDARGAEIALFFGERKPGRPESPTWRSLADGLSGV